MRFPVIRGIIDRRILANFRVDPEVLAKILPKPFRPQLVEGHGIAGICLIRLKQVRPRRLPAMLGITSENAAHRIAVEWDELGERRSGVYVPRRDTSSRLNAFAGGRIFPGVHHRAQFEVREDGEDFYLSMRSLDGSARLTVRGRTATELPADSIFASVSDVSRFFEIGSLGFSPSASEREFDGIELRSFNWHVEPFRIDEIASTFFDDPAVFPTGSIEFDNALLMRGIDHEWHGRESLCCTAGV